MRIDADTMERMRVLMSPLDTDLIRDSYRAGRFPRSAGVRDINKRYRWDLFYAARGYMVLPDGHDLTDAHIDTALRRIVRPL